MMKRYVLVALCAGLCVLGGAALFAQNNLAILPFTGGQGDEGETVAELFSFEPALRAVFTPLPQTSINQAIRSEQRFQVRSNLTNPDTVVALGKQLGAQYIVSGSITALGSQQLLVIAILKIDDLRQIAGETQTYTNIEELQEKLPGMARNIAVAAETDVAGLPRLAVVPPALSGGADPGAADTLARILAGYIIRAGKYAVYPRTASLEQVIEEHRAQVGGTTAGALPVAGQGANPDMVLSVTARKLGNQNMFNAAILNMVTGAQEAGESANYRSLEQGVEAMGTLAHALSWQAITRSRTQPDDLAEVFGKKDARATFNAVSAFLQSCSSGDAAGRRNRIAQQILPGDWIDLPHLTVRGDAGDGAVDTDNTRLGGEKGTLLRLIVVGIDSFAATNRDAPAHVVFQFQNIPVLRRMNPSDTNAGGYKASEMRAYLTNNFLPGLLAAGVPEGVLYAPVRYVANGGARATAADALTDRLWLPTEREVFQDGKDADGDSFSSRYETSANQARLEYYAGDAQRVKYDKGGGWHWWWEASPSTYAAGAASFCNVHNGGNTSGGSASGVGGCAPAFCVR
jgi:hypothetical protein